MSFLKKLFGQGPDREAKTAGTSEKGNLVLFTFNPNQIKASGFSSYQVYAQSRFLRALSSVVKPLGGWNVLSAGLMGCQGDFSCEKRLGREAAVDLLAEWTRDKSPVKIMGEGEFSARLKASPGEIDFVPYAVGGWPITLTFSSSLHYQFLSSEVIGYAGCLGFEPDQEIPLLEKRIASNLKAGLAGSDSLFTAIANTLGLSVNVGIRADGQGFGWAVPEEEMADLDLAVPERPDDEFRLARKVAESKDALTAGNIERAVRLMEEAAQLAPDDEQKSLMSEHAKKLRALL